MFREKNVLNKKLMLKHLLNLVNLPNVLEWGGVCVWSVGTVKERLRRGKPGVCPAFFFFSLSELADDSIIPHDDWCKSSHFLLWTLPPSTPSNDDRLTIGD